MKSFNVKEYVEKNQLKAVSDSGQLETYCKETIKENLQAIEEYKNGKEKSFNYLVGQVMRKTKGTASPKEVTDILKKLIS